jgi:hypothetical protein
MWSSLVRLPSLCVSQFSAVFGISCVSVVTPWHLGHSSLPSANVSTATP